MKPLVEAGLALASLKRELVHRCRFATRAEARREIIRWIEGWYNARRLHSSIAYMTPNEKEAAWHTDRPPHNPHVRQTGSSPDSDVDEGFADSDAGR